jgi:hypothetical protein
MLSEQITVTTTPTSIRELIFNKRVAADPTITIDNIPKRCTGFMLRYNKAETTVVRLTDPDAGGGSAGGAIVLQAQTEELVAFSATQFGLDKALLSANTGTVTVNVVVNQQL